VNVRAASFDEYLARVDPAMAETTSRVLALMRKRLPGATEVVKWGIALFCLDGKEVTGVAARKGFYSLYVARADVVEKYVPRLGDVEAGKGCIRFKSLDGVKLRELERMLDELKKRG
jgi:uncharacterized protein YdhG (YjbR/CyaY superfamily)